MKIGTAGLNLIKEFEGCVLTAYKCPAGVWTIGYGHTGKVDGKAICAGMTITEAKATELLKEDVSRFELHVSKYSETYDWNQNEFDALVSFAYNIGNIDQLTGYGTRSREVIANSIILYNKAGGQVLAGLVRRRQAEQKLFLTKVSTTKKKTSIKTTKKKTTKKSSNSVFKKGKKLTLKNVPLFASATSKTASSKVTGTYYLWSADVVEGKVRITNKKTNVGKSGQVTGWIEKKYAD